jgi:hypothetical protein
MLSGSKTGQALLASDRLLPTKFSTDTVEKRKTIQESRTYWSKLNDG